MDLVGGLNDFVARSGRVLNVTHKPSTDELVMISKITGLGAIIIGVIGLIIAMISMWLNYLA